MREVPVADIHALCPICISPQFDKSAKFVITREEFRQHLGGENALIGKQLKVTVALLDWWWNGTSTGYDSTRVFSDEILLRFLGGRVWTFKPNTPLKIFVSCLSMLYINHAAFCCTQVHVIVTMKISLQAGIKH